MAEATKRYAVVTGANKGIGFAICKQLASNGINVVLTARDEKRGLESVEKLQELGLPGNVVFHQLDVTDSASIASLADFIRTQFCKLDILVNNAGIPGANVDGEALAAADKNAGHVDWRKIVTENYELAEAGLKTNYHGAKELTKMVIPFLHLSDSPKVVNVSAYMGRLEKIPNGWPKEVLSDVQNLTEEKIDDILNEFLKDFKEGSLETKGWPLGMSAYAISKAALNAYTRILAKKYPSFCINAICPGFVKTDMNHNTGVLTPDEGAEGAVRLALLSNAGPSGLIFFQSEEGSF
ncbi:(+)-neomenthol dehydrogenase-like [Gastrolobium bilobum]|uniref:(+)-neomenthol dehydrogenase-like n=1 Tax=Gastrolobium bilobum TaxID=150636 RepID=UPI002AB261F4|nr:(+)-neomenthol dehydrogenase-like [Gastrolobium bilobum]